jgi:hypothetical protein
MFTSRFYFPLLAALLGLAFATGAQAQATRTWVSGVGDDVNPCSRTAPCKTFAGAISKTAAGGEISVLDPGGFGAINITKSITINGEGTLGGILASLTNGVIVNAGVNDVVVLRNISINGGVNGVSGVRFLAGKELHLERVQIQGFTQNGIEFATNGSSTLFVNDTLITNTQIGNVGLAQAGILVKPGAAGTGFAVVTDSQIEGNRIGIRVEDRGKVTLQNTSVARNAQFGAWVLTAAAPASLFVVDSTFAYNGAVFVVATGTALRSEGPGAQIRISGSTVTGSQLGLGPQGAGAILSYSDNRISGNDSDGAPTGFVTKI